MLNTTIVLFRTSCWIMITVSWSSGPACSLNQRRCFCSSAPHRAGCPRPRLTPSFQVFITPDTRSGYLRYEKGYYDIYIYIYNIYIYTIYLYMCIYIYIYIYISISIYLYLYIYISIYILYMYLYILLYTQSLIFFWVSSLVPPVTKNGIPRGIGDDSFGLIMAMAGKKSNTWPEKAPPGSLGAWKMLQHV